ncbi:MAG: multicomponent Na+:H+ antiporter subunit G [Candidatus Azotimanducaceae bacterium]|jgi:multicomponent Na+:H+ antiporter subunit G
MSLPDVFTVVMTASGLFFFFAGSIGLLRFPDVFCRLHALTKADNLGLGLIVIGVLPQAASVFDALQLILIWLLVMVAGAMSCYLVANQALVALSKDVAGQLDEDHDLTINPTTTSPPGTTLNGV